MRYFRFDSLYGGDEATYWCGFSKAACADVARRIKKSMAEEEEQGNDTYVPKVVEQYLSLMMLSTYLQGNRLTGLIPPVLHYLELNDNRLIGIIMSELGMLIVLFDLYNSIHPL
ncbi:hypothetical protein GUJ93_ZPchr0007g5595 [Zizania palustris]|uniref:Uncharacterized protein n=1 Tax=Zizania palustris TaxID=103762 RepID=A0A8J5SN54_ZIZPA|nr:hypothetical protein GUJ93_ZPchr0007g5595 [Zizania palustris]